MDEKNKTREEAMNALMKIAEEIDIENFTEELDIIKKAISEQEANTSEDGNETVSRETYDKLKKAYIEHFGDFTEQKIEETIEEMSNPDSYDGGYIDYSYGMFDATTE